MATRPLPYINEPQERYLAALLRNRYLSVAEITRLHHSHGMLTTVYARMKDLAARDLVQVTFLKTRHPAKATNIYYLSRKGLNYLDSVGVEVPEKFHPLRNHGVSYAHLLHTMAVNDVLIALELLTRSYPQVQVRTVLHEHDLKQRGTKVQTTDGVTQKLVTATVIPDAFCDLIVGQAGSAYQTCIAWEVDYSGKVEQKRWKKKVRELIAWSRGPYQRQFGNGDPSFPLTVAVLAIQGEGRAANLLTWTEEVITELVARAPAATRAADRETWSDMFRITWGIAAELSPEELWLAPRFRRPFDPTPCPLLEDLA